LFYGLLKIVILGPILRLLFRPWAKGLENIPAEGPIILASNHLSFSDSFFMPLMVPRPVYFLAKSDYFTGKGIKGRLTAAFFRGVRSVPIDRSSGAAADPALRTALRILNEGKALGLYPEGTRSPDGRLYKGRTGIARIALESGVPVVPCVMVGTFEIQPPGQVRPKIKKVGVVFGEPLDFSRYNSPGAADDRFILRSITDEIVYALMELSGQEYVDMYATDAKKIISEERAAERAAARAAEAERKLQEARLAAEAAKNADTDRLGAAASAAERLAAEKPAGDETADAAADAVEGGTEASGGTSAEASAETAADSANAEAPSNVGSSHTGTTRTGTTHPENERPAPDTNP
jgi:1-acyl-sn-glycerol-3-phosphate acyltransferase